MGRFDFQHAVCGNAARQGFVAGFYAARYGFPCQGLRIDQGCAGKDRAVNRNSFARLDDDGRADGNAARRDRNDIVPLTDVSRIGADVEEGLDGVARIIDSLILE